MAGDWHGGGLGGMIIRGRVGSLLNSALTHVWRSEGAHVYVHGRRDIFTTRAATRAVGIQLKKRGRRPT